MLLYLTTVNINPTHELLNQTCDGRYNETCFHHTPVIFNLNVNTRCPPGFYLLSDKRCECLVVEDLQPFRNCYNIIWNYKGYFAWERRAWANTNDNSNVIYADYCPFNYCCNKSSDQLINISLPGDAGFQCINGRTGRLCGKYNQNEGFSLAIGSSQYIKCNNNKLKDYHSSFSLQLQGSCSYFSSVLSISL